MENQNKNQSIMKGKLQLKILLISCLNKHKKFLMREVDKLKKLNKDNILLLYKHKELKKKLMKKLKLEKRVIQFLLQQSKSTTNYSNQENHSY